MKARIRKFLPAQPRTRRKAELTPRRTPTQARARLTYDSILNATARILEELGYDALTTNGIAGVAGVAVGAVYDYFPDKETIVAELIRRTMREVVAEIEAAFAGASEGSRKDEAIEKLVRTCMQVLRKRAALMQVFFEQVPFLWELDAIQSFPTQMFAIAWRARAVAREGIWEHNRRAQAYLFLLVPIGRWVPYAAIVDRPSWLTEKLAEDATVEIFKRLLA